MPEHAVQIRDQLQAIRYLTLGNKYPNTDKALVSAIVAVSLEAGIKTNLSVQELLDYSQESVELKASET